MLSNCCYLAASALVSKNLISTTNKLFRSASNTFKKADFVYLGEQEISPLFKIHWDLGILSSTDNETLPLYVYRDLSNTDIEAVSVSD